jgi:hypothetical protein
MIVERLDVLVSCRQLTGLKPDVLLSAAEMLDV